MVKGGRGRKERKWLKSGGEVDQLPTVDQSSKDVDWLSKSVDLSTEGVDLSTDELWEILREGKGRKGKGKVMSDGG